MVSLYPIMIIFQNKVAANTFFFFGGGVRGGGLNYTILKSIRCSFN